MCRVVNQGFGILFIDIIRSAYIQRRRIAAYIEMWLEREEFMRDTDAGIRGRVLNTRRTCNVRHAS